MPDVEAEKKKLSRRQMHNEIRTKSSAGHFFASSCLKVDPA